MADFTSDDLLAILKQVTPVFPQLRFFKQPQLALQRLYPSVEIDATNPQSNETSTQLIRYTTKFEISIFVQYFNRDQDTTNLETLERNILTAIKQANINKIGKLLIENENPQRGPIKDNPQKVNGIQSILVLYFQELAATVGIIGLQQTITLPGISNLQIIGELDSSGRSDTRRTDDSGGTKSNKAMLIGTKYWEYMYTKPNYDVIQALIAADNEIDITLTEGSYVTTVTGKPVYQRGTTRFDGQKTVILQFEIATA